MDERGRLRTDPFSYRVVKEGTVHIARAGKPIVVVGGLAAAKLVAALTVADDQQAQHLLARATGHYKH